VSDAADSVPGRSTEQLMKQVVQNYRSGELSVLDVPVPACKPGGVLVATRYSLISVGTELMKVTEAKLSLLGKARARPDQVRKIVDTVTQLGPTAAYTKAVSRLDSYTPLGYSLCAIVTEVGPGAEEFSVGQLVACAGNEHALHAGVNWVPKNLCVAVPPGVDPKLASFATVGAIAMQGVRRAEVQLGETACVIGLGLIGQLVVQLLVAAGVRVVGLDPVEDRCVLARSNGALACEPPTPQGIDRIEQCLAVATGGLGADHVLLASGGPSDDPVRIAARLVRDRGRVVDIGKCQLDLPWNAYYEKELDVRFSRSYGPGRYDDRYEIDGIDYPAGYVRWTERRNLACFLDLVGQGKLPLDTLLSEIFPVTEAVSVYERLDSGELKGVGFLFEYPELEAAPSGAKTNHTSNERQRTVVREVRPNPATGPTVRVGFIGAGNYASSMLLPHLAKHTGVELVHVATTTSLSAVNAQRRFGFAKASTDSSAILDDDSISTVFVVTRHHSHADLTCRALESGKAVFVEKPLALSTDELDPVLAVIDRTGNDRLMVGFNRRFSPLAVQLRSSFGARTSPAIVRYLVNAGPLESTSWYRHTEAEGSRFEGEGGHFIDMVSWWLDSLPVEVQAMGAPGGDSLVANIGFEDGSIASLTYATNGNRRHAKEVFEAVADGRIARLDNFRRTALWVGRRRITKRVATVDKGQRPQLEQFLTAVSSGGPMPIGLESLAATTRATLAAVQSQVSGRAESV
jgi:predicted dehydrogenase/threonine dehydrogenase-like Zn-dependent dehydrogenase